MSNLFGEFLDDISYRKVGVIDQPDAEDEYVPMVINDIFSRHSDCIFYCNEINEYPLVPKRAHYHYLMHSLRKRKRFEVFDKPEQHPAFDVVREYYGFSIAKTKEALKILSESDIAKIKEMRYTGGRGEIIKHKKRKGVR